MEWASILWRVCFGLMLLALSGLFLYVCAVLNSIRKNLKSVENLTYQEVGPLLKDIDQTVKTLNTDLPQLLKNVSGITASIQQISESEIQPMTHSIKEMTEIVNQNVTRIDQVVNSITAFSQKTVERASYYRDELSIPLIDIISVWSGVKAGWETFRQPHKQKSEGGGDSDGN
jgi:uncharacterized protein YoxC